jgi:hypothetical protein
MAKNAHADIECIKSEYLEAYRERWGEVAANLLTIRYKSGWFYLTASPLSTPYRAREIIAMTETLRKQATNAGSPPPPLLSGYQSAVLRPATPAGLTKRKVQGPGVTTGPSDAGPSRSRRWPRAKSGPPSGEG